MVDIGKKIMRFIGLEQEVESVIITTEVIDNIIELARQAYPNEFIMLLQGSVKNKKLVIESMIFQTYHASHRSTLMRFDLPLLSGAVGSVHSHPGRFNTPSAADLRFFNKHGFVHLIIAQPYTRETIQAYDLYGHKIEFDEE
ncbi:MAG: Mov34/MPN/PAD-1 family protein [archaeon]